MFKKSMHLYNTDIFRWTTLHSPNGLRIVLWCTKPREHHFLWQESLIFPPKCMPHGCHIVFRASLFSCNISGAIFSFRPIGLLEFILNPDPQCHIDPITMVVHTFQLSKPDAIKLSTTSYKRLTFVRYITNIKHDTSPTSLYLDHIALVSI
jgi:hypothetical protein